MTREKGAGSISRHGYLRRGENGIRMVEHLRIAERVFGGKLPAGAVVHHANGNKTDNRNENLVICPDQKYHLLLHTRMAAMGASGNPNYLKCWICCNYDDPSNLIHHVRAHYHRQCDRKYQRTMREKRKTK